MRKKHREAQAPTLSLTVAERLTRIINGKESVSVLLVELKAEVANLRNEIAELQKIVDR